MSAGQARLRGATLTARHVVPLRAPPLRCSNKAIMGYLRSCGYQETLAALQNESGVAEEQDEKYLTLLEKKWTAIVRLQRKVRGSHQPSSLHAPARAGRAPAMPGALTNAAQIMQLEAQVHALQEDVKNSVRGTKVDKSEALPREPAKYTLVEQGHRMPVTRVLFHPVFTMLVSAAEDMTIKARAPPPARPSTRARSRKVPPARRCRCMRVRVG